MAHLSNIAAARDSEDVAHQLYADEECSEEEGAPESAPGGGAAGDSAAPQGPAQRAGRRVKITQQARFLYENLPLLVSLLGTLRAVLTSGRVCVVKRMEETARKRLQEEAQEEAAGGGAADGSSGLHCDSAMRACSLPMRQ